MDGKDEKAVFQTKKPGQYTVSLGVSDTDGKQASGSANITVVPIQFELDGVPAQPVYGSSARVTARTVGPTPQGASYKYVWQASEPGIEFTPIESDNGQTTVTFGRMDAVKIWAQVVDNQDQSQAGETSQKIATVVAPKFTLSLNPPDKQARVGEEVRAKVAAQPEVPTTLIDYRWFDPPSGNRMEYTDNASDIGFKVKDAKPMKLEAMARVPHYGDEIAKITGTYTGAAYEVKIGPPKARGPQLQVWVCDTQLGQAQKCGMKDIPQGQFATFQDIFLQAEVTPAPSSPRYRWTIDPSGSCGLPGAGSELRLNCSSTGSYTVKLQVSDADKLLLGQAETVVNVLVSDNDVKQAPKSKAAYDKLQQARQNTDQGQLDQAIELANSAAALDPKNTQAKELTKRWDSERDTIRQQLDRAKKALAANKAGDAQKDVDAAKKLHPKYPPVIEVEKQIADTRKGIAVKPPGDGTPPTGVAAGIDRKPVSSSSNGASLSLGGDVVEPGGKITLRWQAPADAPDNAWVGLIPADTPHGSTARNDQHDMAYQYIGKVRSGTMTFTAPTKAGSYDLRLSNPANDRELASVTFRVSVAANTAGLRLPKAVFAPGEPVEVSFTASAAYPKNAWVGIIPSSVPHGSTARNDQHDLAYRYVDGKTAGEMAFTAPNKVGSYDLRMNETTNDKEVASVNFEVAVPVEGAQLWLPKGVFKPGEEIRLRFKASPLLPKNAWVGIVPSNIDHGSTARNDQHDVAYNYLDGKASGELVFTAPSREATWDFRLSETTNDLEVISLSFRVDRNAPAHGPPVEATLAAGAASGPVSSGIAATAASAPGTPAAAATPPGTGNVAGKWRTTEGELTLNQSGHNVTGSYTSDGGEIVGEMNGNVLEGFWIENSSAERCATPKSGRYHWGRIRWTFSGDRYAGTWSYCDKPLPSGAPNWTGERIGAAPAIPVASGLSAADVTARTWRFGRGDGSVVAEPVRLTPAGKMQGYYHPNEDNWALENGVLVLRNPSGQVVTRFTSVRSEGGRLVLSGPYQHDAAFQHVLTEVGVDAGTPPLPGGPAAGYVRIEACVDGSDWISIDNGRLSHQHRAFEQIGNHGSCPASHRVAGGGFLVDGQAVSLNHLPMTVGIGGIGRFEVESGRGQVRFDGSNRIVIDDEGPGGAGVYVIRLYTGAAASSISEGFPASLVSVPAASGASLRLERIAFSPGEPIAVQFTAPASWPADAWIGIVPSAIPHGDERQNDNHDITYQYLNKRTSGTLSFTAPAAGEWDFRLHDTDNNGKEHASVSFRVGAAAVPGGRDYTATPAQGGLIFEVGNIGGVANGPTRATTFSLATPHMITLIRDYHWNGARGATPGSIAVRDASGRLWGPWPATGSPGQGGVPNAYWTAHPNVVLPTGTYTVVDSDPASWSHNAESNNRGFVRVEGYPTDAPATASSPGDSKTDGVMKEVDELLDAVKSLKGLFGK